MTIKTINRLATVWVVSICINIAVLVNMIEKMDSSYSNAVTTNDVEICYYNK